MKKKSIIYLLIFVLALFLLKDGLLYYHISKQLNTIEVLDYKELKTFHQLEQQANYLTLPLIKKQSTFIQYQQEAATLLQSLDDRIETLELPEALTHSFETNATSILENAHYLPDDLRHQLKNDKQLTIIQTTLDDLHQTYISLCDTCNGKGQVKCHYCNGKGIAPYFYGNSGSSDHQYGPCSYCFTSGLMDCLACGGIGGTYIYQD